MRAPWSLRDFPNQTPRKPMNPVLVWIRHRFIYAGVWSRIRLSAFLIVGLMILVAEPAFGHEPIFGLGPHVIYQGGIGIEIASEFMQTGSIQDRENEWALHTEVLYGITENLSFTVSFPALQRITATGPVGTLRSTGPGDVILRAKYRFLKMDRPGTQDSLASVIGVKFPTGKSDTDPPIGTGSTDVLLAFTAGHESRTLYAFADLRFRWNRNGAEDYRRGNVLAVDAAGGIRPWSSTYRQVDTVLLGEFSWLHIGTSGLGDRPVDPSGGVEALLGPAIYVTYRNLALKVGAQFAIYKHFDDPGQAIRHRLSFSIETHL